MSAILLPKSTPMTELLHKKSKEGRYRVEPNIAEVDPVIEPLTDLDDDEDAIDRLLINTGFDAEEDVSVLPAVGDKALLPVYQEPAPAVAAFEEDEVLATLQTDDDEFVEPVDIGSPLADIELAPEPLLYEAASVNSEALLPNHDDIGSIVDARTLPALRNPTSEFTGTIQIHDAFAVPAGKDEPSAPDDQAFTRPETGPKETSFVDRAACKDRCEEPFGREPEADGLLHQFAENEAAAPNDAKPSAADSIPDQSKADTVTPEQDIALDAPPHVGEEPHRLHSAPEDVRQRFALLEARAQNTRRLSYAAQFLSLAALCAASYLGYQAVQTRAELAKLKDMQSIMKEDLDGLSEKLDNGKQTAEDSAETPSAFTDEHSLKPESQTAAVRAPASPEIRPLQTAASPALGKSEGTFEPAVRKPHGLPVKPTKSTALQKASASSPDKSAPGNAGGRWSVNLAAFREIQGARKKAEEFRRKGIPVKVTKVDFKHTTWYRLSVSGFATKEAAGAHSARLKKLLRLNSIWVAAI
jgi:cell division septation protein DedD